MKTNVRRVSMFLFAALTFAACLFAQKKLTPSEAKEHFGETATVCGEVVSARYAASSKGQPTFLNLDHPYPNQIFTAVIGAITEANLANQKTTTKESESVSAERSRRMLDSLKLS